MQLEKFGGGHGRYQGLQQGDLDEYEPKGPENKTKNQDQEDRRPGRCPGCKREAAFSLRLRKDRASPHEGERP